MTKEKLEKEAYQFLIQATKDKKLFYFGGNLEEILAEFAEPREKRIAELEQKLEQTEKDLADYQFNYPTIKELQKENAELRNTETMLKVLKDRGVIKSWYYNGSYHIGNELPR